MANRSNCLLKAIAAKLANPNGVQIVRTLNRAGRVHYQWTEDGKVYEWYAKGASSFGPWRRLFYAGQVKCVGKVRHPMGRLHAKYSFVDCYGVLRSFGSKDEFYRELSKDERSIARASHMARLVEESQKAGSADNQRAGTRSSLKRVK